MVSGYEDFVGVGEGVKPVYLGLEFGWGAGVCEVPGVDQDVAEWDWFVGNEIVGIGDADESDWRVRGFERGV